MIQPSLSLGLENQLAQTAADIVEAKRKLEVEEGRDAAGEIRVRISCIEKLQLTLTASLNAICAADARVAQMQAKYVRWRELASKVRAIEAERDELAQLIGPTREAAAAAQDVAAYAERELQSGLQMRLHPFATEPEKARKKAADERLRQEYQHALADVRDVAQRRDEAQTAWFRAQERLDAAQLAERMSRLPDEAPRERPEVVAFSIV